MKYKVSAGVSPLNFKLRLLGVVSFMTLFAGVIVFRLYNLQSAQHQRWLKMAASQHGSSVEVQGARGTVLDSAGRPMAVSVTSASVGVHKSKIKDLHSLAKKLSPIIAQDEEAIVEKIQAAKKFVWLARGLPRPVGDEISALGLASVSSFASFRRHYPQGRIAGPLLGRVGREGRGQSGVERSFDEHLVASDYRFVVQRDARGRLVKASTSEDYLDAGMSLLRGLVGEARTIGSAEALSLDRDQVWGDFSRKEGVALQLTIDTFAQAILEEEFAVGRSDAKAKSVFGLVMDADSGEILAMAQTSDFDPNQLDNVKPSELRNVVVQDNFEPGSTLKPLIVAAALDEGIISLEQEMDCEDGRYKFGRHIIRDSHPVGEVTVAEVLVQSSNICMAKIAQELGRKKLYSSL
ncbi:hypothetical protein BVY02_02160, partial [bacterium J17]